MGQPLAVRFWAALQGLMTLQAAWVAPVLFLAPALQAALVALIVPAPVLAA